MRGSLRESPSPKLACQALPPEYNRTPVCNKDLTEYHELRHSHKMFFDHVRSHSVMLDHVFTVAKVWQISSRRSRPRRHYFLTYSSLNIVRIEFLRPTGGKQYRARPVSRRMDADRSIGSGSSSRESLTAVSWAFLVGVRQGGQNVDDRAIRYVTAITFTDHICERFL